MNEKKPNPPTDPRDGFTPGPWRVTQKGYDDDPSYTISNGQWGVAFDVSSEADARLIASAPTLLADNERQAKVIEAMREALSDVEQSGAWGFGSDGTPIRDPDGVVVCCDIDDCKRQETLVKVRAALALAGGGE